MKRYRVKVHRKGLVVIPAEVRKRFGIYENSYLELIVDKDCIRLIVPKDLRDAFGIDGKEALKVVKLIHMSRRKEIEEEIHH